MNYEVSIQKCGGYHDNEVYRAVKEAVGLLGGIKRFVKHGERILLKPNLLASRPAEAAVTTHPSVVRAVIRLVKEAGAAVAVGDSPGLESALKVAKKCGVAEAAAAESAELIDLKTPLTVENPNGFAFKRFEIAKELTTFDGIINIPKLKTHAQMFLTMGIKNTFGCVPGKKKVQWHLAAGVHPSHFAGMLLDLHLYLKPRLTIIDAVVSMEGNGPASGELVKTGFIAASADAVALDTVMVEILGRNSEDLPVLKKALEWGVGPKDFSSVKILGERLMDVRVERFSFPPLVTTDFIASLPKFLEKHLRKALTSRPHVRHEACTLCSTCIDVCPAEVMSKKDLLVIDYKNCIRCYCCQEICPEGAISAREGWLKKIMPGL